MTYYNYIKVRKDTAKLLYYRFEKIILAEKDWDVFDLHRGDVLRFDVHRVNFDSCLKSNRYAPKYSSIWVDSKAKKLLDIRKKNYNKLKNYDTTCKELGITEADYTNIDKYLINIIYNYIIMYRVVDIDCLSNKDEYDILIKFLHMFQFESCIITTEHRFHYLMRYIGFK